MEPKIARGRLGVIIHAEIVDARKQSEVKVYCCG